jgi:hypothetical protein
VAVNSRNKGARVEREFATLCRDHLGIEVQRNLEQTRSGGHDITGMEGWSPEIKARAKVPTPGELEIMWEQATDQAVAAGDRAVLAVKANLRGWICYIDGHDLMPEVFDKGERLGMSLMGFFSVYRAMVR